MWKINSKIGSGDNSFVKYLEKQQVKKRNLNNVSYGWGERGFDECSSIVKVNGRFEDSVHKQDIPKLYDIEKLPWHLCN